MCNCTDSRLGRRVLYWCLLSACVPASFDAAASVQLVVCSKLLELSVAVHRKARHVIAAGTEQEPAATKLPGREARRALRE